MSCLQIGGTIYQLFSVGKPEAAHFGTTRSAALKLFALCDRGMDLADCIALKPSEDELAAIMPWLQQQDANPDWPNHVQTTVDDLWQRLNHGS